jgi:hypothetical protein
MPTSNFIMKVFDQSRWLSLMLFAFALSFAVPAQAGVSANKEPVSTKPILRDGKAALLAVDLSKLPADADTNLYAEEISGQTFTLYAVGIPAQSLKLELGFVDIRDTAPDQNSFAITADGKLLDPALDIWVKAKGGFTPWVMMSALDHKGGDVTITFERVKGEAFVSYARLLDANGKVLAMGSAAGWQNNVRRQKPSLDNRSYPYRPLKVGDEPFFNADHSPVGGWASFVYGMKQSGGVQSWSQGGESGVVPNKGIIVAVQRGQTTRVMPFAMGQTNIADTEWITESEVKRDLGACSDHWQIPLGVSWTHYTPVWQMKDWETASAEEQRRFVLPVTCMQFVLDNEKSDEELCVLFSLQQTAEITGDIAGWQGYSVRKNNLILTRKGETELVSAEQAKEMFGVNDANSAFVLQAPAHTKKTVTLFVVHNRGGGSTMLQGEPLKLMSEVMFTNLADVLATASGGVSTTIAQCQRMDKKLSDCGQNAQRKFLAAQALHSYQFNTVLYGAPNRKPVWAVIEGQYNYINTFDLTVDHLFYELAVHPWTVRNALDLFYRDYSYQDTLSLGNNDSQVSGGLGFYHDMGQGTKFSSAAEGASYGRPMTQEELQNWILCAALYWKTTGDNAWLAQNRKALQDAFRSMQLRDDIDPAKRDGITTYTSNLGQRGGEITTYDAMDRSLREPQNNLYITVKSFAVYSVLQDVFRALDESNLMAQAQAATAYTAKSIVSHWDEKQRMFPATFVGKSEGTIIPAIEGLIYPYAMGRFEDVSETGPYGELIQKLKQHIQTVLVPGVCIDKETGGWNLTSASSTTWVSKVFLNQFIAEQILGFRNETTGERADNAHYAYEVLGSPVVGFADQIYTDLHTTYAGRHYPRGVTTALWWLWPSTWKN